MVQGLSSSRVERFSVIQCHPNWLWEPPSLLFSGYWGSYLEVKLPVDEAGHSPPPSAEVKNGCSYATTPAVCLHGVEGGQLTFLTFTYEFASQTIWMFLLLQLFYFIPCIMCSEICPVTWHNTECTVSYICHSRRCRTIIEAHTSVHRYLYNPLVYKSPFGSLYVVTFLFSGLYEHWDLCKMYTGTSNIIFIKIQWFWSYKIM